jgi:hypothetical protein
LLRPPSTYRCNLYLELCLTPEVTDAPGMEAYEGPEAVLHAL